MTMKNNNWIFWLIGVGSLLLMSIVLLINYNYAINLGIEKQGIFGDMFGASNAIFTGLSFTGLLIAILLQRQDLKDTRAEVRVQNETRHIEKFENTLFNLINLHNQIIDSLHTSSTNRKTGSDEKITNYNGRKIFQHCFVVIKHSLNEDASNFENVYAAYHKSFNYNTDHYFNSLKQIIILIDNFKFYANPLKDVIEKEKYVSILQSHLSDHEKIMIFYRYIFLKNDSFKFFIEKYGILKGLDEQLAHPNLTNKYRNTAYI